MRGLNLDHLRAFTDVVELGSFSAAADRLALTQPAVSLQLKELEKRFGVRLIERVGRRATPTAAGAELLGHARRIEAAVSAAAEDMERYATGAAGRVRLGTGGTACIYLLPPVLRKLRQEFPSLEIVVSTGNPADILKGLEENTVDVALVPIPVPGRMFEVTPVLQDEFVALDSPDENRLPAQVTPADLARLPIVILFEPGGHTRPLVDGWFARAGVALNPIMSMGSVEAIKELVGAGLGCSVLPSMAVPESAPRPLLVRRPLSPRLHRTLAVVLRRDKVLSRALRETVAALKGLAADRS